MDMNPACGNLSSQSARVSAWGYDDENLYIFKLAEDAREGGGVFRAVSSAADDPGRLPRPRGLAHGRMRQLKRLGGGKRLYIGI
jgi:hypothetical protein